MCECKLRTLCSGREEGRREEGREREREGEGGRERERERGRGGNQPVVLPAASDPALPSGRLPEAYFSAGESAQSLQLAPDPSLSVRHKHISDITQILLCYIQIRAQYD